MSSLSSLMTDLALKMEGISSTSESSDGVRVLLIESHWEAFSEGNDCWSWGSILGLRTMDAFGLADCVFNSQSIG